jgi:hypothetical protein
MICNRKDTYLERTNTLRMFQRMKTVSFQINAFPKNCGLLQQTLFISFEFLASDFVQINGEWLEFPLIDQLIKQLKFGVTVNLIKVPLG